MIRTQVQRVWFFLAALLIFLPASVRADVVTLKDGSQYRNVQIRKLKNSIRIKMKTGETLVIENSRVKSLRRSAVRWPIHSLERRLERRLEKRLEKRLRKRLEKRLEKTEKKLKRLSALLERSIRTPGKSALPRKQGRAGEAKPGRTARKEIRMGALYRSVIFPGLGQYYKKETGKGIFFNSAGLLSLLSIAALQNDVLGAKKAYRTSLNTSYVLFINSMLYSRSSDFFMYYLYTTNAVNPGIRKRETAASNQKSAIGIFVAIYLLNILDASYPSSENPRAALRPRRSWNLSLNCAPGPSLDSRRKAGFFRSRREPGQNRLQLVFHTSF